MALRVTIPLGRGEAPTSFASRLSAANGLPVREFCLDWDIRFQSVVDGDAAAIVVLADKGGVSVVDLMSHAFIHGQNHAFTYRGEQLMRSSLRRKRVVVCPHCLSEDIANSNRKPFLAVYGRAIWQIDAIKTCPVHLTPLVEIADDMTTSTIHEFTHYVASVLPNLSKLVDQAVHRDLTGLEDYVLARLDGAKATPFLDSLALFVAIKLCEMLGAVELFGRVANLRRFSDEQWRLAGAAGFAIAAGGASAISAFLSRLQASFDYSRRGGTEGPQALYGRIYQWLEFGAADAAYNPVRDVIGRHIRDHLPLGPGDTVFGQPVESRTLHSIRTLSLEAQVHAKRLRKLLRAAGITGDHQDHLADANVIFASGKASSVITRAKGAMSLPAAGEYLNAPRVHRALLVQAGFLVPCLSAAGFGAVDQFAVADLDEFLKRLLDGAEEVKKPRSGQVDIAGAAKRANCKAAEIVRLIFDKKLKWVGHMAGVDGYLSVLVDLEEIRSLTRGKDHGGLTPYQVACTLGATDRVARMLIKHGHLKTVSTINPINRCPQRVVMPEEVERFQRQYVSLFALAKERGRHFRKLKQELDASGAKPALDAETIGATFYARGVLSNLQKPKKGKSS
jgi:TniQ